MFFVLVTFLDRALRIIIHLARNAEKGGGVLMSITVPKLKHSFIFQVPVPDFLVFHTPCVTRSFSGKKDKDQNPVSYTEKIAYFWFPQGMIIFPGGERLKWNFRRGGGVYPGS